MTLKKIFFLALSAALAGQAFCQIELRSADDALKIAEANDVERSLQKQSAQESVRLAKKNIGGFLPSIDFSLTDAAKAQKDSDDSKNKTIEFGVTQKIFNGGKTILEWKMQREKSFYQFLNVKKSDEKFKNELTQCYYNVLLQKLKSRLLQKNCQNAELIVFAADLEASEGMITQTEYLETLLQYRQMELEAKKALDEFEEQERALKRMMNIDRGQQLALYETETFEKALDNCSLINDLEKKRPACCQSAVQNSVDIKMAAAELNWAQKVRSMQKRFFLPSVSVRGGVSFSGRNYPLTSPNYSLKVILAFEDNPWIKASVSRQHGFSKGKLVSMADSISDQTEANTIYFSQMRLNKIEIAQKRFGVEKAKKQIEDNIYEIIKKIETAQENFILSRESVKIKEEKLLMSKISLEQGRIKKSDFLEEMNECAKQKIQCFSLLKERDYWSKELEAAASLKVLEEEK
ncbi:MAG: TolC family protein [Treponema sp.]|nr:TolC family protein [Treponema sp.]